MQDGSEVYMDSCMPSNGSCSMVISTIFKVHFLEVGLANTKMGHHGTPNDQNY